MVTARRQAEVMWATDAAGKGLDGDGPGTVIAVATVTPRGR